MPPETDFGSRRPNDGVDQEAREGQERNQEQHVTT